MVLSFIAGANGLIGGQNATLGQIPYQVLWNFNGEVFCGGSIYTPNIIITAAHCCQNINEYCKKLPKWYCFEDPWFNVEIVAGELSLNDEDYTEQRRGVVANIVHPDYTNKPITNDICLLFLDEDLTFNEHVKSMDLSTEMSSSEQNCTVSGWGHLRENGTVFPDKLQFANVQIKNKTECEKGNG